MTIGLFGTCGGSTWRDIFMEEYTERGLDFYNPQVDDWKPELAQIEADHLANDEIILFPVLSETSGLGSLGEVGFSILQSIRLDEDRSVIVMIDPLCLVSDESVRNESIRMRALIIAHLKKLRYPNVYLVRDLGDMFSLSLRLEDILSLKEDLEKYRL